MNISLVCFLVLCKIETNPRTRDRSKVPSHLQFSIIHILCTLHASNNHTPQTQYYISQAFYKAYFYHAKNFLLSMKVVLLVSTLNIPFSKFLLWNEELLWTLQKKKIYIENRTGRKTEPCSHLLVWLSSYKLEKLPSFFLFFKI